MIWKKRYCKMGKKVVFAYWTTEEPNHSGRFAIEEDGDRFRLQLGWKPVIGHFATLKQAKLAAELYDQAAAQLEEVKAEWEPSGGIVIKA